jgi:cytoskeleton protein RodZ
MFEIGANLAAARRARGLAIRDAEQLTCMRAKYLIALEKDRFDDLPGRAYARAFLRTYATALGLRADRFVAEFDEQHPEPKEEEPVPDFRPRQPFHLPTPVPLLAAAAICALFIWSAWSVDQTPGPPPPPPASQQAWAAANASGRPAVAHTARVSAVVVRAVRGPCWIEAHKGSESGPLLAQRTLAQGETVRFTARRVWLRLGAPWNAIARRGAQLAHGLSTTGPSNVTL